MAYLGSTPTTQSFIAGTDYFNGTGAQVAFTLSRSVNSVNDIEVVVNNVEQSPASYSASGTTLTFSAAPSSGTANVYVRYLSTTLQSIGVGVGSVGTAQLQTDSVTTDKIAAGAVIPADLSTGAPSWTSGGLFQFNSGYGSVATAYGCRAWVNFNGTGTVAIRASGNVSSITDNGTGRFQVNFATAMPDTNYSAAGSNDHVPAVSYGLVTLRSGTILTTSVELNTFNQATAIYDPAVVNVAIFR